MADLIDRGGLLHNLRMMPMHKIFDRDVWEVNAVSYYVEQAPTIAAVPVVHAGWVMRPYSDDGDTAWGGELVCSNCGERAPIYYDETQYESTYCKGCGARMDAEKEEPT